MPLAPEYVTQTHRLALGLEPLDAMRGGRATHPVRIEVEGPLPRPLARRRDPYQHAGTAGPAVSRHDSCLHVLLYHPALAARERINLRIYDSYRRYVPRRLSIPLLTPAQAEIEPYLHRVRRPALFPGAAYDVSKRWTGLRGRVLRDGRPMRWARIEAKLADGRHLAWAQGDDRGEFLLLLGPPPAPLGDHLSDPLSIIVAVYGPAQVPVPASKDVPDRDALWDLPLEIVPAPGGADPVSAGAELPATYGPDPLVERAVPFRLGRTMSGVNGVTDFVVQ
jgi:hypothetical protein